MAWSPQIRYASGRTEVAAAVLDPEQVNALLSETAGRLDRAALRAAFREQGDFLALPDFLPPNLIAALQTTLDPLRPEIHRVHVPGRKGGSVSRFSLDRVAPLYAHLYLAPAWVRWLEDLCGETVQPCPARDPHAYALYWYSEAGDYITGHYDTSFYRGKRYTALVGIWDTSTSELVYQLHRKERGRIALEGRIATRPGTFVFFDGDRLYHEITPLGPGQERVVLTLEYVTDPRMRAWQRFISDMKDAISYFGFRQVFGQRPRS